jgi:hypothetical protein
VFGDVELAKGGSVGIGAVSDGLELELEHM